MDEIDEIWEVELFGQYSHWVSKLTYQNIKNMFLEKDIDKSQTGITFITVNGAEIVILLSNISDLNYSNKTQRQLSRERSRKYKEEWETKKEEWEQ